jgi:hypothetical protein
MLQSGSGLRGGKGEKIPLQAAWALYSIRPRFLPFDARYLRGDTHA